eukprot:1704756-Rhodomonas_salina.1
MCIRDSPSSLPPPLPSSLSAPSRAQMIQRAARLRMGSVKSAVVSACRVSPAPCLRVLRAVWACPGLCYAACWTELFGVGCVVSGAELAHGGLAGRDEKQQHAARAQHHPDRQPIIVSCPLNFGQQLYCSFLPLGSGAWRCGCGEEWVVVVVWRRVQAFSIHSFCLTACWLRCVNSFCCSTTRGFCCCRLCTFSLGCCSCAVLGGFAIWIFTASWQHRRQGQHHVFGSVRKGRCRGVPGQTPREAAHSAQRVR